MAIHKLVLQLTVLCDAETLEEATNAYSAMSLSQIDEAITDGEDIGGGMTFVSTETLTDPDRISTELQAIGNDGSFFDYAFEGDEAGAEA